MEQARASDPTKQELREVVTHWRSVVGTEPITVRRLIEKASQQSGGYGGTKLEFDHPDLREALLAVAGQGGAINGKRLGQWLLAQARQIVGTCFVEQDGLIRGTMTWRLVDQGSKGADPSRSPIASVTPEDLGF